MYGAVDMQSLMAESYLIRRGNAALHRTRGHHLLPQMVLIFSNRAVPSPNSLVLAHHNVLGNLVEQSVR